MNFDAFSNRLRKKFKHLKKTHGRKGTQAFRLYDRDIPEFPAAVEWLDGFVVCWVFEQPNRIYETQEWKNALVEALPVDPQKVYMKIRKKGAEQYEKISKDSVRHIVKENELRFHLNLSDHVDVGLFLDSRIIRERISRFETKNKFLNLFAYTGSATVYARAHGSTESRSVDLSQRSLGVELENLASNGIDLASHSQVRGDALAYLNDIENLHDVYDLILFDPPSFSRSSGMVGDFSVQRDHSKMISACMERLRPEGTLIFVTNLRGFKLEAELVDKFRCRETTSQTVPEEFSKHRIHRSYEFMHSHARSDFCDGKA